MWEAHKNYKGESAQLGGKEKARFRERKTMDYGTRILNRRDNLFSGAEVFVLQSPCH